jgi:uncharacterized protein (DUF885 family)
MTLNRREMIAVAGAATALAPLPAFAQAANPLDAITEGWLNRNPTNATALGIYKGARAPLRSRLDETSPAARADDIAFLRDSLKRLNGVTGTDAEVTRFAFTNGLEGLQMPFGKVSTGGWQNSPYAVIQNVGSYIDIPRFLDSDHVVTTPEDAATWLTRFAAWPKVLDGETEQSKIARGKGVVAPDFLLDKALKQLGDVAASAHSGAIVANYAAKTSAMPGGWGDKAKAVAAGDVAAALDRQLAELRLHRVVAKSDAGAWHLPDGDRYYAWALKASTTTSQSPDEIHRTGLAQVEELHAQMDAILRPLGYTQGSVGQRMVALAKDPKVRFADGDEGRAQIMAFIQDQLRLIRAAMPRAFSPLVRGNVEVRRLPLAEEPGAAGAYGGAGSIDGSIPGRFWINLGVVSRHNRANLPTLTHHEAIPGHVWQGEYAQQGSLIRAMLSFNAYNEGWGLYAEQLADELGLYGGDPYGRLGYLQSMAFRAARLVADTGLHAKRWSRAQTVQWFAEANGQDPDEVVSEVERYCSWPGQACGYKVGHNEINRLRSAAKAKMGGKFDLRTFNTAVVNGGNVPLPVLGGIVGRYAAG